MAESNAHVNLSALAVEDDDEFLPSLAVGGRAAEPPVQAFRDAIRATHERLSKGERIKPARLMVPVERKEISVRESSRKDKHGKEIKTAFEQHPNITGIINRLRKAAEAENLGVRIVVDYHEPNEAGVRKLKITKGANGQPDTVRVRFVGQKRKQRTAKDATTPAA